MTPYWRFVCDLAANPIVEEIVCIKGAQVGWSEVCRNLMGYWIDLDPGPVMVLMPDQKSAEDFRDERVEPLMRNTPAVKRHVTQRVWDSTKHRIKFDTCSVFFVWAGSKTGTKSKPIRRLICEEPDEYPPFSSTGGDPLSKAEKRLTTYRATGRSTLLLGGTPTRRQGNTWKRWELCAARYHIWLPCPHCGKYQVLRWKQVKWPDVGETDLRKRAERIKVGNLAYYECEHCVQPIYDHQKPRMLRRGVWATEDEVVLEDGRVVGPTVEARRVGVSVPSLYSPDLTFGELAAEFLEAQGDPNALADFVNQRLAEPFEEQRAKTEPTIIAAKAKDGPQAMLFPKWATHLIATADTQGVDEKTGYFWYVIRAWAPGFKSQLVDHGVCHSKPELIERCLDRPIPAEVGGTVLPQGLFPDANGPRLNEVYQLSQGDPRIHPCRGAAKATTWMVQERPQKAHDVVLWLIDTEQSKDLLHQLIHDPDPTRWMPNRDVIDHVRLKDGAPFDAVATSSIYCSQMAAESKVFDPRLNRETWVEIVKNNNHLYDCEHMQCAVAWRWGLGAPLPAVDEDAVDEKPKAPAEHQGSWATGFKGRY